MAFHPAALLKLLPLAVMITGAYFGRGHISALSDDLRIVLDSLPLSALPRRSADVPPVSARTPVAGRHQRRRFLLGRTKPPANQP